MKIALQNTFITDNSKECENACFWLKSPQNERFADEALQKGAKIIDINECKKLLKISPKLQLIGITGTNGKTTTAAIISHILTKLGHKNALCGTRGAFIDGERIGEKGLTTAPLLQTLGYMGAARECEFFVMEVSSHALVQRRIDGLCFAAKIYTNLTQDHLDFHGDFANYQAAKESFFKDETLKLINADAVQIAYNKAFAVSYGIENVSDYKVSKYDLSAGIRAFVSFNGEQIAINSRLLGLFNLYNILAAFACVNELLHPKIHALQVAISDFAGVSGRVEEVASGVIVDFAHTPDGIEKVLSSLCNKKLIVVFGAGGDRDKSKRALMGRAAQKYASKLIITSDNPRSEDENAIIADIVSGLKGFEPCEKGVDDVYKKGDVLNGVLSGKALKNKALNGVLSGVENVFIEPDRKKAIAKALEMKADGDLVVILGKGDESYQEIKGVKHPFNDALIVRELLKLKEK